MVMVLLISLTSLDWTAKLLRDTGHIIRSLPPQTTTHWKTGQKDVCILSTVLRERPTTPQECHLNSEVRHTEEAITVELLAIVHRAGQAEHLRALEATPVVMDYSQFQ